MPDAPILTVACLCAAWCGVCRDYRAAFDTALATRHGVARFVWVDVEDEADRLGELEVETFPTLLIARDATMLFSGPVTPSAAVLERLIDEAVAGRLTAPPGPSSDVAALLEWLSAAPASPPD